MRRMIPHLLKTDAPFKSYTQNKIPGDFLKWKFYFVCQFVPKRYLRVLKIQDVKQLNITSGKTRTPVTCEGYF